MRSICLQITSALVCAAIVFAQRPETTVAVPKLVRFSGSFRPAAGTPAQTMESVTLSVYRDQTGGDALWHEIQNVVIDTDGHYSVLMGATRDEGMPLDLFTAGEPRWLGVQFNRPDEAEQPRVLLVSVPYALKAADSDTLGGKPASAYLLAAPAPTLGKDATSVAGDTSSSTSSTSRAKPKATPDNSGQPNYIGKFTNTTDLIDSAMYEVNGNVGIFTTAPAIALDVRTGSLPQMGIAGTTDYLTFFASDKFGPAIYWDPAKDMRFGKGGAGLYNPFGFVEQMRIQSSTGNVGIGTMTPGSKLEVDTATGTAIAGIATPTSGISNGVYGQSATVANGSAGVSGNETATTGVVYGVAGNTSSATTNAAGVNGNASSTTGVVYGVLGSTSSTGQFSAGVIGYQGAATGQVYGTAGSASSTGQFSAGVNGFEGATTGQVFGVSGFTPSTGQFSAGVNGHEAATTGQVFGVAGDTASTTNGAAGVNGREGATTGQVYGVAGFTASTSNGAAGVNGYEGATTGVVYGLAGFTASASSNAAGVNGIEGATTGQVYGVAGSTSSTTSNAAGVNGFEGATTGQVYGVAGFTASTSNGAAGVNGFEGATTGQVYGVGGSTNSTTPGAAGMTAYEGSATGQVYGIVATTPSTSGIAAFGNSTATSGFAVGVEGATASPAGVGGEFVNTSGSGLVLLGASGSGFTHVFTVDASGNGVFAGNLNVTGNLVKGSGSFKIDHPLDPGNKYLSHSFVESPDMMNVYNGMMRLDAKGEAWVTLPEYFEALNGDYRYQLTAIGAPAPRLYVAQEVSHSRFKIAGGRPGGRISWQVTGIRHDAYANAHRIPVTEDKPSGEQGRYLHPDVVTTH